MSDKQKFTVSYDRASSMDLPEADAAAEREQCLDDLRKVDQSIPPMPEGDINDPLSPLSRWWCEHFFLPLLADDAKDEARKVPAVWKALRLIAVHRLPPPAWLAYEMLAEDFPSLPRKNAASLFIDEIERLHAVACAITRVQQAGQAEGFRFAIDDIVKERSKPWNDPAKLPASLNSILAEARDVLVKHRSMSQRQAERMLEMFRRFNECCDRLP